MRDVAENKYRSALLRQHILYIILYDAQSIDGTSDGLQRLIASRAIDTIKKKIRGDTRRRRGNDILQI